jgi:hypothetical protein
LNPVLAATLCGLAGTALWAAGEAQAHFADSAGFSGKAGGQTCTACHNPPSPIHNDAKAVLEGLPGAWRLGATYNLTVRVEGGPPALPAPQAQGGFDIASDGGGFQVPAGKEALLRPVGEQELTYRPDGTHQREWRFAWQAPDLRQRPAAVHVWLAVLSANGNHVVATNTSDQGETLDAAASLTASIPADPSALAAWKDLPLQAPRAEVRFEDGAAFITGSHRDGNATRLRWRLDGQPWSLRETGPTWGIRLLGLPPGDHLFEYRSEGSDRESADQALPFRLTGGQATQLPVAPSHAAPLPSLLLAVPLLAALFRRNLP